MAGKTNYEAVELPDEKPLSEYTYTERRAYILERVKEVGTPRGINQREIADEFGCTPQNISKDMNAIADYVDETLGDRRELNTKTTVELAIQELLNDGEWRKAAKTALELDEWIRETKDLEEMMDRIEKIEEQRERAKYR